MPRVPIAIDDLLAFCHQHAETWSSAPPSAVGLTGGEVAALQSAADEAVDAVAAQAAAQAAARAATLMARTKVAALRGVVAGCIRSIVVYAEAQSDPAAVFAAGQIAPAAPPSPSRPPGQPMGITAALHNSGNIGLRWKCANPPGGNVVYSVLRRDGGGATSGAFVQIGVTGARAFTDDSIPAGSTSVQYQIRAYRGRMAGPASAVFTLQFGRPAKSAASAALRVAA
jgi:hypothetical protein